MILSTPEVDLTESGDSFQTNLGLDTSLRSLMPGFRSAEASGNEGLETMSRTQLEKEIVRLRTRLAESERENADLIVQMKLLDEGSRTSE